MRIKKSIFGDISWDICCKVFRLVRSIFIGHNRGPYIRSALYVPGSPNAQRPKNVRVRWRAAERVRMGREEKKGELLFMNGSHGLFAFFCYVAWIRGHNSQNLSANVEGLGQVGGWTAKRSQMPFSPTFNCVSHARWTVKRAFRAGVNAKSFGGLLHLTWL